MSQRSMERANFPNH